MGKSGFESVIIYYFTGTGNAKNTAVWIESVFNKNGIRSEIRNIANYRGKVVPPPPQGSLTGICSPTHGFHFPEITRKFIRKLPEGKNCKAFIINTRAGLRLGRIFLPGLSGLAHYISVLTLWFKGYKIIGLRPVDLPSNWISLHPAVRKKGTILMAKRQKIKVEQFTKRLINGKNDYRALKDIIQDILISPLAIGYALIGRYAIAKTFVASHKCTDCGLCIKSCPVNAIKRINGRMFWKYNCESCMHCMNVCPERAIESAHGFFIGFLYLFMTFFMSFFIILLNGIFPATDFGMLKNPIIDFIIASIFFLPFLFLGYRIIHWLMRYRIIERIVIYTSLTSYRFWGRFTHWKTNYINYLIRREADENEG